MPLMKFFRTWTYILPSTAGAKAASPVDSETPAWPLSGTGAAEPRVLAKTTMQKAIIPGSLLKATICFSTGKTKSAIFNVKGVLFPYL